MTQPTREEVTTLLRNHASDVEPRAGAEARVRQRLEERLLAQRGTGGLGYYAVACGGVVLLASLVLWFFGPTARGGGTLRDDSQTVIQAASPESSLLTLSNSRLVVRAGADVSVERDEPAGTDVRLRRGSLFASVDKRQAGPFVVRAGGVRVEVTGTLFGVELGVGGAVSVSVLEGSVRVLEGLAVHSLGDGGSWGGVFKSPLTLRERSLLGAFSASKAASVPAATPAEQALPALPATPASATPSPVPILQVDKPAAGVDPMSAYRAAKKLELDGQASEALVRYRAIAASSDKHAEDALFAVLRIQRASGDTTSALESAQQYRSRYPAGRYGRDVDVHVMELRVSQGQTTEARAEAERFLARYPNDPRAFRFRRMLSQAPAATAD